MLGGEKQCTVYICIVHIIRVIHMYSTYNTYSTVLLGGYLISIYSWFHENVSFSDSRLLQLTLTYILLLATLYHSCSLRSLCSDAKVVHINVGYSLSLR